MKIYIHKYGKGFPLVFFHGWGFDSRVWLSLLPQLDDFQVVLVDLPGFGHSPVMDWDKFKNSLLNQLPNKFALIGWSMGGLYAMRLATEEPEKVDYLVNVTTSPRFILDDLWAGVTEDVFQRFHKKLAFNPSRTLKDFLELQGLTQKEIINFFPKETPSPEGLKEGLSVLATWDLREKLKQYSKPSCFMFGRFDPIVPIKTMKCMEKIYPNFRYVFFEKAAHMPFFTHTNLFIEEVRGIIIK